MNEIRLRDFHNQDIPLFKNWLYVPHVAKWYHQPSSWIDEVEKRESEYKWIHHYIAECDGKPIGFCQYYEYQKSGESWHGDIELLGTYSIDYLIGETDYLKKGFGKRIINTLSEKIKQLHDARRIIVQPEAENNASCNTLLAVGFTFDKANELYLLSF